jgi:hypothetical protein
MIKFMALAAAGCGVFCLPVGEAVLVTMGFGGLAAFVCEWETAFLVAFVAFAAGGVAMAGAALWRRWKYNETANQLAKEVTQ